MIDLRSDTLTKPTPAMREAMARAEVGDDVFGEDPTIIALEEMSAQRMGKQAGLFVASGTMGNLVSLLAQCGRGDEVILGDQAHTYIYEQGGSAALGGIHPRAVHNQPDGTLDLDEVEDTIRTVNVHFPAHEADYGGEHTQSLRRHAANRRVHAGVGSAGSEARDTGARRRRTDL